MDIENTESQVRDHTFFLSTCETLREKMTIEYTIKHILTNFVELISEHPHTLITIQLRQTSFTKLLKQ